MVLKRLAEEMTRQGMRAEDLASKTGLSIRTILNAREGKSVSVGTATLIALKLKVKADDLMEKRVMS